MKESRLFELLKIHQLKIATAESCTGGLVASRLCDISGISSYFEEGYVVYSENAKMSAISAIGGIASAFGGGTIFHTHHLQGQSDRYADKIIDYSRCPVCHSTDIICY